MSDLNELLASIPTEQIAARLGVDQATAETAIRQALPALIAGMSANAQEPSGAASLAGAVEQHDPALVDGGADLAAVNPQDGEKIVGHVFGGNREQVISTLGGLGAGGSRGGAGITSTLMAKLLPLLAPIVMAYLAKRLGAGGGSGTAAGSSSASGTLIEILGSLLRQAGSSKGQSADKPGGSAGGIDIGGILGDLLGAGRR